MLRTKLGLAGLLVVLIASAVMTSSASARCIQLSTNTGFYREVQGVFCANGLLMAAHPYEESNQLVWLVNGMAPMEGTEEVEAKGGAVSLEDPSIGVTIKCSAETDHGEVAFGLPGTDKTEIELTGCKVGTTCVAHSSGMGATSEVIKLMANTTLKETSEKFYDTFRPLSGPSGLLVTIEIAKKGSESCLFSGTYEVTGETCAEAGAEAVHENFTFSKAIAEACGTETKLQMGGKAAFVNGSFEQDYTGTDAGATSGVY